MAPERAGAGHAVPSRARVAAPTDHPERACRYTFGAHALLRARTHRAAAHADRAERSGRTSAQLHASARRTAAHAGSTRAASTRVLHAGATGALLDARAASARERAFLRSQLPGRARQR